MRRFDLNQRFAAVLRTIAWLLLAAALTGGLMYWQTVRNSLALRITLTRVGVVAAALLLLARIVSVPSARARVRDYFNAETHPANLAIFRIVLFALFLHKLGLNEAAFYSTVPDHVQVAPAGLGWLMPTLPISPWLVSTTSWLLGVFCFSAMIGLFSRTSAMLAAILGVYVLGIPQFFGKVSHNHLHLIWFGAILAASRCGDVLSVDALIAAARGRREAARPSRVYALPLRFIWLLIGIAYFFPGFWKLWSSGIDWIVTDNMRLLLHQRWMELGGWVPAFRMDLHPVLCRLAAAAAVGFDISFVFLIFHPRLRRFALLAGIGFHETTRAFMQIDFTSLALCYTAFIDWHGLAVRIPFFNRLGRLVSAGMGSPAMSGRHRTDMRVVATVGAAILTSNVVCGLLRLDSAWPFACYPTFARLASSTTTRLRVVVTTRSGRRIVLDDTHLRKQFGPARFSILVTRLLAAGNSDNRVDGLTALWGMWAEVDSDAADARSVRFSRVTLSTDPDVRRSKPIAEEVVAELYNPSARIPRKSLR